MAGWTTTSCCCCCCRLLRSPWDARMWLTESDETTVKLESDAESITRLQDMMSYQPDYFVGRYVYKYFEASRSKEAGVFMGLVLDCDEREGRPGQFVWLVHYTDGFREDFDLACGTD